MSDLELAGPRRVVVVEGPDGSGKTTLAKAIARKLQAMLVHHGSYLTVQQRDLAGIYEQSMMPALLGATDVVLDRSWHSEPIYGRAVRDGLNRVNRSDSDRLDAAVAKSKGTLILCTAGYETCLEAFRGRPAEEYLKKAEQLQQVWNGYRQLKAWWEENPSRERAGLMTFDRDRDGLDQWVMERFE